jgi:hypothetical protein
VAAAAAIHEAQLDNVAKHADFAVEAQPELINRNVTLTPKDPPSQVVKGLNSIFSKLILKQIGEMLIKQAKLK